MGPRLSRPGGDGFAGASALLLGDPDGLYSLAGNTHDLLVRFLSALPLAERSETGHDGLRVSLDAPPDWIASPRLGLEIIEKVTSHPAETVGDRLAAATVCDRTAAVMVIDRLLPRRARIAGDLESGG